MKAIVIALVLAATLALPSSSEAGLIRRVLARRVAPRAAIVNVQINRGARVVAVRRGFRPNFVNTRVSRGIRRGR